MEIRQTQAKPELSKAAQTVYEHIGSQTNIVDLKHKVWKDYGDAEVNAALTELYKKNLIDADSERKWVRRRELAQAAIPEPRMAPKSHSQDKAADSESANSGTDKSARRQTRPKRPYRKPTSQNEHHKAVEKAFSLSLQIRMYGIGMHTLCFAQTHRDDPLSPSREITPEYLAKYLGVPNVDRARAAAKALVEAGLFIRVDNQKGGRPKKRTGNAPGSGAVYRPVVPDLDPS